MSPRRSPIIVLARKELSTMLNAPATYVVCVLFLVIAGWLFVASLFEYDQSNLDTFLRSLPIIFTFLIPALTMRLFSEEFRGGTIEYLATLPIKDYEIVLGKYLAALALLGFLLLFTLAYPVLLMFIGHPDVGQMIGSYAAVAGIGAFYCAIGLWASSMTRNQVVAFIIGFFTCFVFFLLSRVADLFPALVASFIRGFSVEAHFDALSRGVIDTRDLLYWVTGSSFFLGACLTAVHARRWR